MSGRPFVLELFIASLLFAAALPASAAALESPTVRQQLGATLLQCKFSTSPEAAAARNNAEQLQAAEGPGRRDKPTPQLQMPPAPLSLAAAGVSVKTRTKTASAGAAGVAAEVAKARKRLHARFRARRRQQRRSRRALSPLDASWFSDFSAGESTFNADAVGEDTTVGSKDDAISTKELRTVISKDLLPEIELALPPLMDWPTPLPREWFSETASGGAEEAWQTYFPAEGKERRARRTKPPPWHADELEGGYQQNYISEDWSNKRETLKKGPGWFEAGVVQEDAYGRPRAPTEASRKFYVDWDTRRQNATFRCSEAGCSARANLTMPRAATEEMKCFLDVLVHPTDFDDPQGLEVVQRITANGRLVSRDCAPQASGCLPQTARTWHACVDHLDVDHLLGVDGKLTVEAQISPWVDECPYEGDLLSGVITLSCFVRERLLKPMLPLKWPSDTIELIRSNVSLECGSPGCEARGRMEFEPLAPHLRCHLGLRIRQTDYDAGNEEVEWVSVNGRLLMEHLNPGRNPCQERLKRKLGNTTRDDGDDHLLLVAGKDVTAEAATGQIEVAAKISDAVDDCALPGGQLLHALAVVICMPRRLPRLPKGFQANAAVSSYSENDNTAVEEVRVVPPGEPHPFG